MKTCYIISDTNLSPLQLSFKRLKDEFDLKIDFSPYDQVIQSLSALLNVEESKYDYVFIAVSLNKISSAIQSCLNLDPFSQEDVDEEVNFFIDLVKKVSIKFKAIFITSLYCQNSYLQKGLFDLSTDVNPLKQYYRFDQIVIDSFSGVNNTYVLDSRRWLTEKKEYPFNNKMWYLAKILFKQSVYDNMARDLLSAIKAINGKSKKLIICDLDNTLWGGIVGDDGYENLKLGGIDPLGEAFYDFQKALLAYKKRGILLAIVSKNNEEVALEAVEKNPYMLLKKTDFVGWRINWDDKVKNIIDLVETINVGFDSVVFIDDSDIERARVKQALPEILVPEWDSNPIDSVDRLHSLNCFATANITQTDKDRSSLYKAETQRLNEKTQFESIDIWLQSLNLQVEFMKVDSKSLNRVEQLLNRTNQFNLQTRRLTQSDLETFISNENNLILQVSAKDKFGDYGCIGLFSLSIDLDKRVLFVEDFILSCRVMGRFLEYLMIKEIYSFLDKYNLSQLVFNYSITNKNKPCRDFFIKLSNNNALFNEDKGSFILTSEVQYPDISYINVKRVF